MSIGAELYPTVPSGVRGGALQTSQAYRDIALMGTDLRSRPASHETNRVTSTTTSNGFEPHPPAVPIDWGSGSGHSTGFLQPGSGGGLSETELEAKRASFLGLNLPNSRTYVPDPVYKPVDVPAPDEEMQIIIKTLSQECDSLRNQVLDLTHSDVELRKHHKDVLQKFVAESNAREHALLTRIEALERELNAFPVLPTDFDIAMDVISDGDQSISPLTPNLAATITITEQTTPPTSPQSTSSEHTATARRVLLTGEKELTKQSVDDLSELLKLFGKDYIKPKGAAVKLLQSAAKAYLG